MVIGFDLIAEYNENGAGTTTYMRRLFQEMGNSYDLSGNKFIIYKQECISEKYWGIPDTVDVEFVNVPNVGAGFKRVLFEQTLFYKYLKPCDVLFSNCTSLPLYVNCKRIFTQHDVYYLQDKKSYGLIKRLYRSFIVKMYLRRCHKVLTVSQYSKDQIIKAYDVPESKIVVTYNFINTKFTDISEPLTEIKDYFGKVMPIPEKFFLYVGRLQHNKNVRRMVQGFEKYKAQNEDCDIKLILIGEPAFQGDEVIAFLKSQKDVIYLGYADNSTVKSLQKKCLAVVLTSLYEGFGIPIIEGFANGKVCLTSNTSSLPEVAGKAGVLVDPYNIDDIADGYKNLLANIDTLKQYIPEQLAKFSASAATEAFMQALGIKYNKKY